MRTSAKLSKNTGYLSNWYQVNCDSFESLILTIYEMTFLTPMFVEILSFGHLFCNFHRKISVLKLGRGRSKGCQEKKRVKNSGKMHRGQTALP